MEMVTPPKQNSACMADTAETPVQSPPCEKKSQLANNYGSCCSSSTDDSPFIIPSFLNSIVYDGLSENRLYAINTNNNVIKVRRSDQGFVFSRCVGLQTFINGRSVKKRDSRA